MERWRDWALAPLLLTQTVSEPGESRVEWLDQADMLEEMGLNGEACKELITALMLHFIIISLATAAPSAIRPSLRPSVVQLRPLLLTCSTPSGNDGPFLPQKYWPEFITQLTDIRKRLKSLLVWSWNFVMTWKEGFVPANFGLVGQMVFEHSVLHMEPSEGKVLWRVYECVWECYSAYR